MPRIKAVLFDFMGTCLDWHSSVTSSLPTSIPASRRSTFALTWRQAYFDANAHRLACSLPPEDFTITLRNTLNSLLSSPEHAELASHFPPNVIDKVLMAWYQQPAWPDVGPALRDLRSRLAEDVVIVVHANGTTRLQLSLARSSGLRTEFDMLFSSQMLGVLKPSSASYRKALELLGCDVEECVMVAAHAEDVRGAKKLGMKTVYVYRWTDDVLEDQSLVKEEGFDAYLAEGMGGLGGVVEMIAREA